MSEIKVSKSTLNNKKDGMLDMVIAFDTTGSMSCYIEDVRKHVKELIPELLDSNPDMQLSIVAFGDYCDMEDSVTFGDAYQVKGLTRDANSLIDFVNKSKDTSGGDGDEFYELVLHRILNETEWRDDAKKSILLIADAQPHKVGYSYKGIVSNAQYDWRKEMEHAQQMNVEIDTLSLCTFGEDWYKELSAKTNGVYSKFQSSSKTSDFVRTVAYARGGELTSDKLCAMATMDDMELSSVAVNYMAKNISASAKFYNKTE